MVTQCHGGRCHKALWILGPVFTKQVGLLVGNILPIQPHLFIHRSYGAIVVSINDRLGG